MPEKEYHHVRIKNPAYFDKDSFRIVRFDKGIKATIGCRKGQFHLGRCQEGTKVQKLLFPKDKYTKGEAKQWVKKHPKIKAKKKKK